MNQAVAKKCEGCGADITPEQIVQRQAGLVKGVLLCPACVETKRREALEAHKAATGSPTLTAVAGGAVAAPAPKKDLVEEPISLVADGDLTSGGSGMIRSFSRDSTLSGQHQEGHLKRAVTGPADPPTRCRTFHGKLTPAAIAHMDGQINDWLDAHPNIYIKHVTSSVGPFEAKHVEQHLILTVFY